MKKLFVLGTIIVVCTTIVLSLYFIKETERGWARGSTKNLEEQAFKDFMIAAIRKGNLSIPAIKNKANEGIKIFVTNWLLNLKDVNISGVRIEIADSIPAFEKPNIKFKTESLSKEKR